MNNEKYIGFKKRLIELRESKKFKTKTEFSNWLGISRNIYSMVESGYRNPSKKFIERLSLKTGLSEQYWLYGIEKNENINNGFKLNMVASVIDQAIELNIIKYKNKEIIIENENAFNEMVLAAIKIDILNMKNNIDSSNTM